MLHLPHDLATPGPNAVANGCNILPGHTDKILQPLANACGPVVIQIWQTQHVSAPLAVHRSVNLCKQIKGWESMNGW